MSVFRIEKNRNYTIMSNYHLRDKQLSYKAKGLLSFMLSLPDDWDYSLNGLIVVSKEGIKAIRNILKELQTYGYLVINKKQNTVGQFEYEYLIYEIPYIQNGDMDKGYVEKGTQIKTKEEIINNKEDKLDKKKYYAFKANILLDILINSRYISDESQKHQYLTLFIQYLCDGTDFELLVKVSYYIINVMKESDYKDELGNEIIDRYNYFKTSLNNNIKKISNYELDLWD